MGHRRINSPLIAVATLGVLIVLSDGATSLLAQSSATLRGAITDTIGGQSNGAIADATVSLYSTDRILQTRTDRKGQFEFSSVPPGTYLLEATHPGFKTKQLATVQVTDKSAEPISITMDIAVPGCQSSNSISYTGNVPGRTVRGSVLDSTQPLADAEISLASASGVPVAPSQSASQRSGGKGEFTFTNLEPGQYVLRVSHPGYHDEITEPFWIVRETGTSAEVQMLKQGLIRVCQ